VFVVIQNYLFLEWIERGAVITFSALVHKDVQPIVGGLPAKIVGTRKSLLNYKLHYKPWFK
jgi:maltose O-acetyltransferase